MASATSAAPSTGWPSHSQQHHGETEGIPDRPPLLTKTSSRGDSLEGWTACLDGIDTISRGGSTGGFTDVQLSDMDEDRSSGPPTGGSGASLTHPPYGQYAPSAPHPSSGSQPSLSHAQLPQRMPSGPTPYGRWTFDSPAASPAVGQYQPWGPTPQQQQQQQQQQPPLPHQHQQQQQQGGTGLSPQQQQQQQQPPRPSHHHHHHHPSINTGGGMRGGGQGGNHNMTSYHNSAVSQHTQVPPQGYWPGAGAANMQQQLQLQHIKSQEESHSDTDSSDEDDEKRSASHMSVGGPGGDNAGTKRGSAKRKNGGGSRETSEMEKRLKKNAREQKRANKINDQIAIMKEILESCGMNPPATKSSILAEGICLVRSLLAQVGGVPRTGKSNFQQKLLPDSPLGSQTLGVHPSTQQQHQAAQAAAAEPYWLLFRKSATPLAMCRPNGEFIDCNTRFCEVFGCSCEELQKENIYSYTLESDLTTTNDMLDKARQPSAGEESSNLEVILTNKHHKRFLVRVSALYDDHDKPRYLLFTPRAFLRGHSLDLSAGVPTPSTSGGSLSSTNSGGKGMDTTSSHCRNSSTSSNSTISTSSIYSAQTHFHQANQEPNGAVPPPHLRRAMG